MVGLIFSNLAKAFLEITQTTFPGRKIKSQKFSIPDICTVAKVKVYNPDKNLQNFICRYFTSFAPTIHDGPHKVIQLITLSDGCYARFLFYLAFGLARVSWG